MNEPTFDLGPCCCCGKHDQTVRNVVYLHKKSPISGKGWGCLVCNLPLDGASYVCCDSCLESKAPPKFACRGYPSTDGRIPIEELQGEQKHNERIHEWYEGTWARVRQSSHPTRF